jgi:hypothetical protein
LCGSSLASDTFCAWAEKSLKSYDRDCVDYRDGLG